VVAGDSAGGGLALALAMALRDAKLRQPAAVAMICPWLDLVPDHAGQRHSSPGEALLTPEAMTTWARAYANGHDPDDPAVSPLRGDLDALPPLILHSAADDPLVADAEALATRASRIEHVRLSGLWHVPHVLSGVLAEADEAVATLGASLDRHLRGRWPRVAIVGAGMSGLCVGESLKQAGIDEFTIYEKADEVGGTWRENRYPGLTCDVPSRFYSYSFAPNPDWSSAFSPGPEIQGYFVRTSRERGLRPHIRFGAEVADARWENGHWTLRTAGGESAEADVLVTATGVLHHPKEPAIPGRETFAGPAFHSARWPAQLDLRRKRVAVVGTGSTGVQITVAAAGVAERLFVFQRTPQWIAPVPNHRYLGLTREAMRRLPVLNRLTYRTYQRVLESILGAAVTRDGWQRTVLSALCRANLRLGVRDHELRIRLAPDYEPMCKRLVMSAGFYTAMQRDDVELVTAGIDHVEPRGIVTEDGVRHELDVIVFATGFDAHAYMRPMTITGEHGVTLEQAWADGPRAYRTIALPGFPNLFTIMGPHSPIGNHSLIAVAETQAAYVVAWIQQMRRDGLASVAPTPAATSAYYDAIKAALPGTVWVTGCQSWYLDQHGDPELWPWTPARHRRMLARPEPADYAVEASESPRTAPVRSPP
jgi:cation diffusion facilitator CzcD-associated flavoprotein CzcO